MEKSTETLRIPSHTTPSLWNNDTALFGATAFLVASFLPGIGPLAALGAGALGMLGGGIIGKERMAREAREGKAAPPPSFWNRGVIIGAAIGNFLILPLLLTAVGVAATGAYAPAGLLGISALAAPVIGGVIGGFKGKERMTESYQQAEAYVAAHGNYNGQLPEMAKALEPERTYRIPPEEAKLLEERLSAATRSKLDALELQGQTKNSPGL